MSGLSRSRSQRESGCVCLSWKWRKPGETCGNMKHVLTCWLLGDVAMVTCICAFLFLFLVDIFNFFYIDFQVQLQNYRTIRNHILTLISVLSTT